jgi:hypothetical protein
MATYRYLDDFTTGDTYMLIRMVPYVPEGFFIEEAWWTVKESMTDTDAESMFSLCITLSGSANGEVTNYPDGTSRLRFIAQPSNSLMMSPSSTYYYDVHVNLSSGDKYQLEYGKIFTGYTVRQVH